MFFAAPLIAAAAGGGGAAAAGGAAAGIGGLLSSLFGGGAGEMAKAPIRVRPGMVLKDYLLGDNPLKSYLGTAPLGSSQGILPAALGNVGLTYRTSGGQKIGPIRPFGPSGFVGGLNRSYNRLMQPPTPTSAPIKILRPGDDVEYLRGYSNILGGYQNA